MLGIQVRVPEPESVYGTRMMMVMMGKDDEGVVIVAGVVCETEDKRGIEECSLIQMHLRFIVFDSIMKGCVQKG